MAAAAYLQNLGKLSSSNIGINIQDLTLGVLGQAGQDRQTSSLDSSFNRSLVDSSNLSDETVFSLVEVFGSEYTGGDRSGACTESFEGGGELEVLLEEYSLSVSLFRTSKRKRRSLLERFEGSWRR
jgi:hypothetical protein